MPVTLTLPQPPSQEGWDEKYQPNVLAAPYGDGYTQRAANGINYNKIALGFNVNNLTEAEYNTLNDFFKARGGWESFYWTMPQEDTPRLWTCGRWSFSGSQANLWNGSFEFREEAL